MHYIAGIQTHWLIAHIVRANHHSPFSLWKSRTRKSGGAKKRSGNLHSGKAFRKDASVFLLHVKRHNHRQAAEYQVYIQLFYKTQHSADARRLSDRCESSDTNTARTGFLKVLSVNLID